jgi:DNA replication protein DnaC
MIERGGSNEKEEAKRINSELLRRRAVAKAEAMTQHGDTFAAIKMHLSKGEHDPARQLAHDLRETPLFLEIITLFQEKPETFHCGDCGGNMEGLAFRRDSLTWVQPRLCDSCEEGQKKTESERQRKDFADFVRRNIRAILLAIGVPTLLLSASYEGFPEAVADQCKRSVMGKHGLYLGGDVGRGKSWLAVAVLMNLILTTEASEEVRRKLMRDIDKFRELYRFVYVPWLLIQIKSSYGKNDYQAEEEIIKEYTGVPVLLLDDLGVERPTDWVREKLNIIVDFRNNRGLKTIYTSNKMPQELQERLDERITSRIFQRCEIIHLTGPDRRRQ